MVEQPALHVRTAGSARSRTSGSPAAPLRVPPGLLPACVAGSPPR